MIKVEFENLYEKGDTVIFKKNKQLLVGIITGYYVDFSANNSIWYNIATGNGHVFTYTTGGDIHEWDIICRVSDEDATNQVASFIKEDKE